MKFCERFGISPLEYQRQPADVVAEWSFMLGAEAEGRRGRDTLAGMRAGTMH